MRDDIAGMFWDDTPPPKVVKEKIKRTPPEPVWLAPDYLPSLDEALAFDVPLLTDEELVAASQARERFVYDVEVYPNFFCVAFTSTVSGKSVCFELSEYEGLDHAKLKWCVQNLRMVGFNSRNYDQVIMCMALAGYSTEDMWDVTVRLIQWGDPYWIVMRQMKLELPPGTDHMDIMEVCPLSGSLKAYGARLFGKTIWDLPFEPGTTLTWEQQRIVKLYNINDNDTTVLVVNNLLEQIALREALSARYKMDLRSKSDAQIAEAVIGAEIKRITGKKVSKPVVEPGYTFYYEKPHFIQFSTDLLQWALNQIVTAPFVINDAGYVTSPEQFE